jgi:hypothetical protein
VKALSSSPSTSKTKQNKVLAWYGGACLQSHTWEAREGGCEFEASPGYIVRACLKKEAKNQQTHQTRLSSHPVPSLQIAWFLIDLSRESVLFMSTCSLWDGLHDLLRVCGSLSRAASLFCSVDGCPVGVCAEFLDDSWFPSHCLNRELSFIHHRWQQGPFHPLSTWSICRVGSRGGGGQTVCASVATL